MDHAPRIALTDDTWLLVLTGAGVSAESGVPTFRSSDGLWEQHRIEQVATPEGFCADPALVWRFYSERRRHAASCAPNPGHVALAEVEAALGDRFLLATQNIDGLHRAAGSRRVVEMHGNLFTSRCASCGRPPFEDRSLHDDGAPACDLCAEAGRTAPLRPHIVWFGEARALGDLRRIQEFAIRAAWGRFVFLAVGTSGVVYPAAALVEGARQLGAETWLVNADPPGNLGAFDHFVQGKSGEILPRLFG